MVPASRAGRDDDGAPTWIEVSLSWGTTPLHVDHLREPRDYLLHDAAIAIAREGEMFAVVPDETSVTLVVDGRVLFRRDAERAGLLVRDEQHPRASLFHLERGRRCRFESRGLVVQLEGVAGEPPPLHLRARLTRSDWIVLAISAVLHVAAIAALLVTNPSLP